ncbi:hypothetical protein CYMTET_53557, partial [Cymbomonas tetramitiformis]
METRGGLARHTSESENGETKMSGESASADPHKVEDRGRATTEPSSHINRSDSPKHTAAASEDLKSVNFAHERSTTELELNSSEPRDKAKSDTVSRAGGDKEPSPSAKDRRKETEIKKVRKKKAAAPPAPTLSFGDELEEDPAPTNFSMGDTTARRFREKPPELPDRDAMEVPVFYSNILSGGDGGMKSALLSSGQSLAACRIGSAQARGKRDYME